MFCPETKICGSPTPNASTRFRMFSSACCITGSGVSAGAWRMTETPPSRSRPSDGFNAPVANPISDATTRNKDHADGSPEPAGSLHASSAPLIVRRNRASKRSAA